MLVVLQFSTRPGSWVPCGKHQHPPVNSATLGSVALTAVTAQRVGWCGLLVTMVQSSSVFASVSEAKCSPVVERLLQSALGYFLSSQCSTTGVIKAVLCNTVFGMMQVKMPCC